MFIIYNNTALGECAAGAVVGAAAYGISGSFTFAAAAGCIAAAGIDLVYRFKYGDELARFFHFEAGGQAWLVPIWALGFVGLFVAMARSTPTRTASPPSQDPPPAERTTALGHRTKAPLPPPIPKPASGEDRPIWSASGDRKPPRPVAREDEPLKPTTAAAAGPGLRYCLYEGSWEELPDMDRLTPNAQGTVDALSLPEGAPGANYAICFSGLIDVPRDGLYTFHVRSDDGSRLSLDNHVVVDNDGVHAALHEKTGRALLLAGRHEIALEYFQRMGKEELEISYEGPGLVQQTIPKSVLFRKK